MRKIIIVLFLFLLSGCDLINNQQENLYQGDLQYYEVEEVDNYTIDMIFFGVPIHASIKSNGDFMHVDKEYGLYGYLFNEGWVTVYETEDHDYVGIYILHETSVVDLYDQAIEIFEDYPLQDFEQVGVTNQFTYDVYTDDVYMYQIQVDVNEDLYVTGFHIFDPNEDENLLGIYNINSSDFEIPTHNTYHHAAYVMGLYPGYVYSYDEYTLFIESDTYLFEIGLFYGDIKLFLNDVTYTYEVDTNQVYHFLDSNHQEVSLEDIQSMDPSITQDLLDDMVEIQYYIRNIADLFPQ